MMDAPYHRKNSMLSWTLDSLSRRADRWVREWGETSSELGSRRYPLAEKVIRLASEHPIAHLLTVSLLTIATSAICWAAPRFWDFQIASTAYSGSDFLAYFSTLWTLQATLAALVYPLVIAFVAVLLQRRASAKLSLRLYAIDAAVAPSGVSALSLVAWMTFQYFALPYVEARVMAAAMVGNIVWFLHNSLLTAWFLYRTVQYLDDGFRYEVFSRFAIRVAFPREVHEHLLGLMFSNAQTDKVLPGASYGTSEAGPQVLLYPMTEGQACVVIPNPDEKVVVDVRLRLLRWAILLWLRQSRGVDQNNSPSRPQAMLLIPIVPGEQAPLSLIACRVQNAPTPGWLAQFLIRKSVVLGPPLSSQFDFSCSDVLEEIAVEAMTLVEQKRYEAARETISALVDVHAALIKAGAFKSNEGLDDNATLLPSPYGFASQRIHERWLNVYRPLAEVSVQTLAVDMSVYERHCHLVHRMSNRLKGQHLDILVNLLHISGYLMYRLGIWWTAQIEERGVLTHNAMVGARLPLPIGAVYDRALQRFVEGWEAVRIWESDVEHTNVDDAWAYHARGARFAGAQLDKLVRMILTAISRGDTAAATWLIDSFANWFENQHYLARRFNGRDDRYRFLTFPCLRRPWAEVRSELGPVAVPRDEREAAEDVMVTVLHRYWTDLRLVLVLILLDWTTPSSAHGAFTLDLAASLIKGENPRSGEVTMTPLKNPEQLLFRIMRIELDSHSYGDLLDTLVDDARDLRRPDMMAGRIYSRSGSDDVASLRRAQAHLLIAVGSAAVERQPNVNAIIDRCGTDLQLLDRISRLTSEISSCVGTSAIDMTEPIPAAVRFSVDLPNNLDETRTWMTQMLAATEVSSKAAHQATLANAQISLQRLYAVAVEVSRFVLSQENDEFPFTVATSRNAVVDAGQQNRAAFTGVRKAPLTEPPLEPSPDTENARFNNQIATNVAGQMVWDYLRRHNLVPLPATPERDFLVALTTSVNSLVAQGQTPILLLSSQKPEWTFPYQDIPVDGITVRPPNQGDVSSLFSYVNDIAAHAVSLAGAASYVVPLEDFISLQYTLRDASTCISVTAAEMANQTLRVEFVWQFSLTA